MSSGDAARRLRKALNSCCAGSVRRGKCSTTSASLTGIRGAHITEDATPENNSATVKALNEVMDVRFAMKGGHTLGANTDANTDAKTETDETPE